MKKGKAVVRMRVDQKKNMFAQVGRLDGDGRGPSVSNWEVCPVDNGH